MVAKLSTIPSWIEIWVQGMYEMNDITINGEIIGDLTIHRLLQQQLQFHMKHGLTIDHQSMKVELLL